MKIIYTFFMLFVGFASYAQTSTKIIIVEKEPIKDKTLQEFIDKLSKAVKKKDAAYILSITANDVFSGEEEKVSTIEDFKKTWNPADPSSRFWKIVDKLLKIGGSFVTEDAASEKLYLFPYIKLSDNAIDVTSLFFTDESVQLKEEQIKLSKTIAVISNNFVIGNGVEENYWMLVSTLDHKKGYILKEQAWHVADAEMTLAKKDGKWKITALYDIYD